MREVYNPQLDDLDYMDGGEVPCTTIDNPPKQGQLIINTTTNTMKIYYLGTWWELHNL